MPSILSKKLEGVALAWRDFQTRAPVKLRTVDNERNYQAMVTFLDELVDEIGDRKSHPLMGLLDIVALFVTEYEDRNIEIPNPRQYRARRITGTIRRTVSSPTRKSSRARASAGSEKSSVYRGIEIPRITGKRSPTSLALREALRTKYGK